MLKKTFFFILLPITSYKNLFRKTIYKLTKKKTNEKNTVEPKK